MKNLIETLKQRERDLDSALRELANMQLAFENVQHDIDVLRSALQLCVGSESSEIVAAEAVRSRAYEFYEQRGYKDGFDREDWQRAEAEILGLFPAAPEPCPDSEPVCLH